MEKTFIFLFCVAVFLFALISMGVFLLIVRISLMFTPVVHIMGMAISAM